MKEILSKQAGRVLPFISSKRPSEIIPFKGDFPIVQGYQLKEFYTQINSHEYLDECPQWVQDAVLRGEQIAVIHNGFMEYLTGKNMYDEFIKMSAADKSTELVRFMDSACLGLDRLKI